MDWEANLVIRWYEREQTRVGVQSVKSWATEPGNIDADDLFVSGNADEVLLNGSSHVFSLVPKLYQHGNFSLSVPTGSYVKHSAEVTSTCSFTSLTGDQPRSNSLSPQLSSRQLPCHRSPLVPSW